MKNILVIIFFLTLGICSYGQERILNYKGMAVDINTIPIIRFKEYNSDELTKLQTVFDKNEVAISQRYFRIIDNNSIGVCTRVSKANEHFGYFELLDNKGNNKWTTVEKDLGVGKFFTMKDNLYSALVWGRFWEDTINHILKIYDQYGIKVFEEKYVEWFEHGNSKSEHLYFFKNNYCPDKNEQHKLFYRNLKTGESWEHQFSTDFLTKVYSVSGNGKYIIIRSDQIYLLNYKNEIIWTKDLINYPGHFKLSEDGSHSLNRKSKEQAIIYNNFKDSEFVRLTNISSSNELIKFNYLCFVKNTNLIANAGLIAPLTYMVTIFNYEGDIIESLIIPNSKCFGLNIISHNGLLDIYFNGLLKRQYQMDIKNEF